MGEIKLYAALALLAALCAGGWYYGHTRYEAGKASTQSKWDAAKVIQEQAVAKAEAQAAANAAATAKKFNAISDRYEAILHAQPPSIADSVVAGVHAGTIRLRDDAMCSAGGSMPGAHERSHAADAAATQALADRIQDSISAIRAGGAADARERQLDAQVIGLQSILKAEREP